MRSADAGAYDDAEQPLDAVCARHPERRASIVCPHCGSFACGDCTVDTLWGDVMCEECRHHGRMQYPLPWEHSLSPASFLHTAYLVFAETKSLFGALPAGRVTRALGFAALMTAITATALGVTRWLFIARNWHESAPSLTGSLLVAAGIDVLSSFGLWALTAALFHGAAIALGGRAPFSAAVRATCYVSTLELLQAAGRSSDTILGDTTLWLLLGLVTLFFLGWALSLLGEHRYGLSRAKAIAAGITPVALHAMLALVRIAASAMLNAGSRG